MIIGISYLTWSHARSLWHHFVDIRHYRNTALEDVQYIYIYKSSAIGFTFGLRRADRSTSAPLLIVQIQVFCTIASQPPFSMSAYGPGKSNIIGDNIEKELPPIA